MFAPEGFGQQHRQVGVQMALHEAATAAAAARPQALRWRVVARAFTQPGLAQHQREGHSAHAGRAVHQQSMAAMGAQGLRQRVGQPGQRQFAIFANQQIVHAQFRP